MVRLGLSEDERRELVGILTHASGELLSHLDETRQSSHLLCQLLNSAAKFLVEIDPEELAQQAIRESVGLALDAVGGVLAASPYRAIVINAAAACTEKLTAVLAVPDLAKAIMALRMLATLVCPDFCRDSEEAAQALGRIFTARTMADALDPQTSPRQS